jgi:hypothetical protein
MKIQMLALTALLAVGCSASTQGRFLIPPNTQLQVNDKPVTLAEDGSAKMSAFGWGGARYKLVREGKVIDQGKLETKFRAISIIWPPFGLIYVPKGLKGDQVYDLTKSETQAAKGK